MSAASEVREMDEMGAHSDVDGCAWFPRSKFPTRASVRTHFCDHFASKSEWIELRVLARYMRFAPELDPGDYDGEYWTECEKDAPGAFAVWRVE